MAKTQVVTARLDDATLLKLDRLAVATERSRAWIVGKAVLRYIEQESEFLAFMQEGDDAIDRGEFLTQAEMEQWFEERVAKRPAGQIAAE